MSDTNFADDSIAGGEDDDNSAADEDCCGEIASEERVRSQDDMDASFIDKLFNKRLVAYKVNSMIQNICTEEFELEKVIIRVYKYAIKLLKNTLPSPSL